MKKLIMFSALVLLLIPNIQAAGIAGNPASQPVDLGTAPKISIGMTPHNPPIILPSSGGTFIYTISIANETQFSKIFDVWTALTLPDGSTSEPLYGPVQVQLPIGWGTQSGDLSEYIGPEMPAGEYTYTAYIGRFPSLRSSSASFTFEKLSATPGWYTQNSGTSDVLSAVDFVDPQEGWAVGQNTVLHTTDGGDNWFEQPTPTYYNYFSVDFVDSQVGWVVGGFGTILYTTNGGLNWIVQDSGYSTGAYTWSDVRFMDENNGWVVGGYSGIGQTGAIILHTDDGGLNWETQFYEDYHASLQALSFIDSNTGWVISNSSDLLYTDDGGATWTPQDPGQGDFYRDVFFIDSSHGWIAEGYSGQILRTTDGGDTWEAFDVGEPIYIESLYFTDANTGWLAGGDNYSGMILGTSDGGQNWQEQYSSDLILFGIDFADSLNGWAVGWEGAILHTETGGG